MSDNKFIRIQVPVFNPIKLTCRESCSHEIMTGMILDANLNAFFDIVLPRRACYPRAGGLIQYLATYYRDWIELDDKMENYSRFCTFFTPFNQETRPIDKSFFYVRNEYAIHIPITYSTTEMMSGNDRIQKAFKMADDCGRNTLTLPVSQYSYNAVCAASEPGRVQ